MCLGPYLYLEPWNVVTSPLISWLLRVGVDIFELELDLILGTGWIWYFWNHFFWFLELMSLSSKSRCTKCACFESLSYNWFSELFGTRIFWTDFLELHQRRWCRNVAAVNVKLVGMNACKWYSWYKQKGWNGWQWIWIVYHHKYHSVLSGRCI